MNKFQSVVMQRPESVALLFEEYGFEVPVTEKNLVTLIAAKGQDVIADLIEIDQELHIGSFGGAGKAKRQAKRAAKQEQKAAKKGGGSNPPPRFANAAAKDAYNQPLPGQSPKQRTTFDQVANAIATGAGVANDLAAASVGVKNSVQQMAAGKSGGVSVDVGFDTEPTPEDKKKKMFMWIGVGVGALVLIGAAVYFLRKKKK